MNRSKAGLVKIGMVAMMLSGCASHNFIPTGMTSSALPPQSPDCGARVLLQMPTGSNIREIGLCMAQTPGGGMISDNTPGAILELQRCACLHGGNAIVLSGMGEAGMMGSALGYSQQVAKAQGVAIRFE